MIFVLDTEGTTVSDASGTYGVLYSWDILALYGDPADVYPETVGDLCEHIEGRNVDSLYRKLLDIARDAEDSGSTARIGVHNLTYDFGYLRHFFTHADEHGYRVDVCARNSTHIITASLKRGRTTVLVLFDTLALFRTSLRSLGESLGYRKLELDYEKSCAPDTLLSASDIAYNRRDTELLMVALCRNYLVLENLGEEVAGTKVVTKTGMVRQYDRCSPFIGQAAYSERQTMYDKDRTATSVHQFSTPEELGRWSSYTESRGSDSAGIYAGGVNLANTNHTGCVERAVQCYDLKSAYPGIMLTYRIPTGPEEVPPASVDMRVFEPDFPSPVDVATGRCGFWIADVEISGLCMREDWRRGVGDSSATVSMARQHGNGEGVVYRAGYLFKASRIVLTLSTPMFFELCCEYTWESIAVLKFARYTAFERPTVFSNLSVMHHFAEKTTAKYLSKHPKDVAAARDAYARGYITYDELKRLESGTADEYWLQRLTLSHKENLNGLYGIKVTNPLRDSYSLDEHGYLENNHDADFDSYKATKRDKRIWRESGVLVSLYNRYKIVYACRKVVEAGGEVLYVDTDSIKCVGLDKETVDAVFAPMHADNRSALEKMAAYTERHAGDAMPMLDDGFWRLGEFDYEGCIERFYTPGHKKYAFDEGKGWRARCAGYKVSVVELVLRELAEVDPDNAPLLALGFDVRYDSTTDIATVLSCVSPTWKEVSFEALDASDADTFHTFTGCTCPGYAVLPAGKVMNNTAHNVLNQQRFAKAASNNPDVVEFSRVDIAKFSDRDGAHFAWGKRGTVPMAWRDFSISEGGETIL